MSHLSVALTTTEEIGITDSDVITSGSSRGIKFYFVVAVVIIGVIGTAANGLILYALVASKQHKKYVLIVHQNVLDLISCFLLIISYSLRLHCNISLTGVNGYWYPILLIIFDNILYLVCYVSIINLAIIAVERYLTVVHPICRKKKLRNWMIYSAMALDWIASIAYTLSLVFPTTIVPDGKCDAAIYTSESAHTIQILWDVLSFYVLIVLILFLCYWRILVAVRRQARVVAGNSAVGSNASQAQLNHIQTDVIKTMILVCAFYAILWFPMNTVFLLWEFAPDLPLDTAYYISMFLAFLYICINPFIYATKFQPVKRVLIGMITCQKPTEQASENVA